MHESEPRMPLHLGSRATRISDLTEALYWAIDAGGLRTPPRREIARRALVSEATVSRRFRDSRSDEQSLVLRLVAARRQTYPPGFVSDGWARWTAATEPDLRDARVWLACLSLAAYSPTVAQAVCDVWCAERDALQDRLDAGLDRGGDPGHAPTAAAERSAVDAEVVQVLLLGLSVRQSVDLDLSHERAAALLLRVVEALAGSDPDPAGSGHAA